MQRGWRRLYPAPAHFVPRRVTSPEYLDDPGIPEPHRSGSLRDLELLAGLPTQFPPLWNAIRRLLEGDRARALRDSGEREPWRLLELGAGSGHLSARVANAAGRRGIDVTTRVTDREPAGPGIVKLDWLLDDVPGCDVAFANLVLHHFTAADAVRALRKMNEAARLGGVIYDLNRNRLVFDAMRWTFPLFVSSPVTVADALISVQQAFTPAELLEMAGDAGIARPRVSTHLLARNLLWWERA